MVKKLVKKKKKSTRRAKAYRYVRRHSPKSIPLGAAIGIGQVFTSALFGQQDLGIAGAVSRAQNEGIGVGAQEFIDVIGIKTLGFKPSDGSFWWDKPSGPIPFWFGIGISTLASMLGVNRILAQKLRGIPLLNRIRI